MTDDPAKIRTLDELKELLNSIQMVGTRFEDWDFEWFIEEVVMSPSTEVTGWFIQSSFERPDLETGSRMQRGSGRRWFVERGSPRTGVVFTAWMAIQQIIIHELHESFTVMVDGQRVRLLDPHKRLTDLAVGSRRVDGPPQVVPLSPNEETEH